MLSCCFQCDVQKFLHEKTYKSFFAGPGDTRKGTPTGACVARDARAGIFSHDESGKTVSYDLEEYVGIKDEGGIPVEKTEGE